MDKNKIPLSSPSISDDTHPTPSLPEYKAAGKLIRWENGVPIPCTKRIVKPENIQDIIQAAVSLPFTVDDDDYDLYPELYGLSYAEVAAIKLARNAAKGDTTAINALLDRMVGKPKQSIETKNLNMSYQDYLDKVGKQTQEQEALQSGSIDIEPIDDEEEFDIG